MIRAAVIVLLLSAIAIASEMDPSLPPSGFHFVVTEKGAQKFMDITIPIIVKDFQHLRLPDIHADEDIPVVGKIHIDITNLIVQQFQIPSWSVQTGSPNTFLIALHGSTVLVKGDWHWRKHAWPHVSDHGNVEISPEQADVGVSFSITPNPTEHLVLKTIASHCDMNKFKIKFGGHWDAWLYNLFVKLLGNTIKKNIDKAVADELKRIVDTTLTGVLAKLATQTVFGGGGSKALVDIGFSEVAGTNVYLTFGIPFLMTNFNTKQVCPIQPGPLPLVDTGSTGRHIEMFVAQSPLNCAIWVSFVNQAIKFTIPDNTTAWAVWIPNLQKTYPNMPMADVYAAATQPSVSITPAGISGLVNFNMSTFVTLPDKSQKFAFTLGMLIDLGLDAHVAHGKDNATNWALYFNVTKINIKLSVVKSDIGDIDINPLQGWLAIIDPIIQKAINAAMAGGIPLPVGHGISLVNPIVTMFTNYLEIAADIGFQPSQVQITVSD
jgi:hypothetical protein